MPVLGAPELTEAAIADCLAQSVPVRLLIVNQGVPTPFRSRLEQIAEEYADRILLWHHDPPLPSLSATWNRALRFCWESGADKALVINNDVRLRPDTVEKLETVLTWPKREVLFVTAVGVTGEQFAQNVDLIPADLQRDNLTIPELDSIFDRLSKGGPDFSCYMLRREAHERYPFDEGFIPAFTEDVDQHRRYMLNGDGHRIFSINLPFHHIGGGSQTLKSMSPEARAKHEARIGISRAHYKAKWGGDVNQERYTIPFDPESDQDGVTTPELQKAIQAAEAVGV
jgi:hypothetical protein